MYLDRKHMPHPPRDNPTPERWGLGVLLALIFVINLAALLYVAWLGY